MKGILNSSPAPTRWVYAVVLGALLYVVGTALTGCSSNSSLQGAGSGWGQAPRAETGTATEAGHFPLPDDNQVNCLAFLPDGRRVAIGDAAGAVWLLDIGTGKPPRRLKVASADLLTGGILALAVSPDGSRLLAGCADDTVKLIDVPSGRLVHTLKGHGGPVWSVAFLKDGRQGVSGSTGDYTIRVWDLQDGKEIRQMRGEDTAECLAIADDQKTIAASDRMKVTLWDITSGERVGGCGIGTRVRGLSYSPDGLSLVTATTDGILVSDSKTGKELHYYRFKFPALHFALSPDGRWALLGGMSGVLLTDIETGEELQRWDKLDGPVRVVFSPDGRYAVGGAQWDGVHVWDLPKSFEKKAAP